MNMNFRPSTNLDMTLKFVAILMLITAGVEFLIAERLQFPPVIVANIYFVLSIFAKSSARRIAVIAFGLACVVLVDSVRSFLAGSTDAFALTITVTASAYLVLVSYGVFRREAATILNRTRQQDPPVAEDDES